MKWNYRVCRETYSYKQNFPDNERLAKKPDEYLYSIREVYYNADGSIKSIGSDNNLINYISIEGVHTTWKLIGHAFEKPAIDIDAYPFEEIKEQ